jgi:tripartite-type tricarboxylate transporter receptor subunit TctC
MRNPLCHARTLWMYGAFAGALITAGALAQSYPLKPIRVIVPTIAGGNPDFVARPVLQKMAESLKQAFVFDNRPGAGGIIGVEAAVRSAPDGYTLLFAARGHVVTPAALQEKLPYDATRDLTGISRLVDAPFALFVHPSLPVRSVRELVALAKARPGELTYASFGVGSSPHFTTEAFSTATGIRLLHVPYKGSAPAATALLGGEVMMGFDALQSTMQHLKTRRLRALAIGATHRVPVAPDIPTFIEAGGPDLTDSAWYGLFAPALAPREVVAKLHAEAVKALAVIEIRELFERAGMVVSGSAPEQFTQQVRDDIARYAKIARDAGMRAE